MTPRTPIIYVADALALLGEQVVASHVASHEPLYVFLTDSRSLASPCGTAFVALTTASGDGHLYIDELYGRGVRTFLIEQPLELWRARYPEGNWLQVVSPLEALQRIARAHRQRYRLPVVGITGSNGKTIVKEYLNTLLQDRYQVCRSPRSYNSQIGVPLSVLQLREDDTLALFEAGISMPQEMSALSAIIAPTIGVLTSLGSAHSEGFASRDALLAEKMILLEGAEVVVAPLDALGVAQALTERELWDKVVGWSRSDARARLILEGEVPEGAGTRLYVRVGECTIDFAVPMQDRAALENILTTLSVIFALEGQVSGDILARLGQLTTPCMRLEIKESHRGNTLINDAYSNDLEALAIALDVLRRRAGAVGAEPVVVLSDIEQSALPAAELYAEVARLLGEFGVRQVYAVGEAIEGLGAYASRGFRLHHYPTTDALRATSDLSRLSSACILIKGARRFGFERIYRDLSRLEHQTTLEVDLSAVRHNLAYYRSLLTRGERVVCMIKANGYGIGAFELAKTLEEAHVDYLAVAAADEGKQLRMGGIKSRIMVMNPDCAGALDTLFRYQLEPEVYSLELLAQVLEAAERQGITDFPIHLKLDSGMHRLGLSLEELPEALRLIASSPTFVRLESIFSHLASADDATYDAFTAQQAERLIMASALARETLGHPVMTHLLNTAGIARFAHRFAFDMVRLGIGLYGISPVGGGQYLRPVCQLSTTVLQVKQIEPGEAVGYGCADVVTRPTRVAVIPIGYADGLRRSLGQGGWSMLLHGRLCPTIGKICMDACMLDVTEVPEARPGDRVTVFGGEARSVEEMAAALGTIAYEVLTTLSPRIQRLYYQD